MLTFRTRKSSKPFVIFYHLHMTVAVTYYRRLWSVGVNKCDINIELSNRRLKLQFIATETGWIDDLVDILQPVASLVLAFDICLKLDLWFLFNSWSWNLLYMINGPFEIFEMHINFNLDGWPNFFLLPLKRIFLSFDLLTRINPCRFGHWLLERRQKWLQLAAVMLPSICGMIVLPLIKRKLSAERWAITGCFPVYSGKTV